MANDPKHGGLPYPIRNAKFTFVLPHLDADGDPTDPSTPDTEISKDGGAFSDCTEEVSTISGGNGSSYLTLTGAEMDANFVAICSKAAGGPKATLLSIYPRILPVIATGTASAGASSTITLANSTNYVGCIVRTTGGTGGGGTGGANNQARMIVSQSGAVATISPNWETNPANDTTYDILLTELYRATADVNVVSIAGENVSAMAELTGDPGATPSLVKALMLLYMKLRNKVTQTATEQKIHNSAGSAILTAAVSDNGTTTEKGKFS
jgi:hypothetical protein